MKPTHLLRNFLLGSALLAAVTTAHAADGTYTSQTGAWNAGGSWSGNVIASGADFTAFFTNDVTDSNRSTSLGEDRTIGNIVFTDGDISTPFNRVITGNTLTLTLDVTTASPVIDVTQAGRELQISNIVAGNDGLTKTGAGILRLNNTSNSFTGKIAVTGGQLRITTSANQLGADPGAFTADHITLSNGSALLVTSGITTLGNRGITLGTGGGQVGTNNTSTFDVAITGAGSLSSANFGGASAILTLSGNNTYSGGTNVNNTAIQLGHANALGSNTAQLSVDNTLIMNDFNATVGNLIGASTGRIRNNGVGTSTLTIGNGDNGGGTFAGVIEDGTTGTVALTKTGSAKITLSGVNTYTGATNVNGGILAVNGELANTSSVIVGMGATLQGSGVINSSVTILEGGTLASGNSIESLATGNLSFANGSNFQYEIDRDAAAGEAGDLSAASGSLSLTGTVNLSITDLGSIGAWELGTPLGDAFGITPADKLTLISYNGTWNGGLFTYNGNLVENNSGILINGQQWWFQYDDTSAGTNYTTDLGGATRFVTITIPEPSTALLGGLGLLALLRRRRY